MIWVWGLGLKFNPTPIPKPKPAIRPYSKPLRKPEIPAIDVVDERVNIGKFRITIRGEP